MNTMSYDAVTIGNREFDHGWDNTLLQLSQATFPIVQGNIFYQNSDKSFWDKPYTIIEKRWRENWRDWPARRVCF